MRIISAWFLIVICTCHWLGGHLWFEISYLVEVRSQMNESEQLIAQELKQEVGLESEVRIVNESEITPRGNFYGGFVFSTEKDSSTIYYTIEYAAKTVTLEKVATHVPDPSQETDNTALIKSLLKEFMFPQPESIVYIHPEEANPSFNVAYHFSNFFASIPSPPPDLA